MRLVNFFRIVLAAARVLLLIEFAKTTRSTGGFDLSSFISVSNFIHNFYNPERDLITKSTS